MKKGKKIGRGGGENVIKPLDTEDEDLKGKK